METLMTADKYRIEVAPAAARPLRKLDPQARRRIQAAVELLTTDPRPPGARKLVGGDGLWRVRTGDYRIVYQIHDRRLLVLVVAPGHRRAIYRNLPCSSTRNADDKPIQNPSSRTR
jgi:mRNA interferase RelE/StbE